jgi:hypothetical protein
MLADIRITRSEAERVDRYGRWDDEVNRLQRAFTLSDRQNIAVRGSRRERA